MPSPSPAIANSPTADEREQVRSALLNIGVPTKLLEKFSQDDIDILVREGYDDEVMFEGFLPATVPRLRAARANLIARIASKHFA